MPPRSMFTIIGPDGRKIEVSDFVLRRILKTALNILTLLVDTSRDPNGGAKQALRETERIRGHWKHWLEVD